MEDLVLSCLESRVEENRNLYARFLVGPFLKGDALTVATALRRVLLSSIESIGITALYIQGITHEFSTIVGVRESVLELSLNFGAIVLSYDKTFFQKKSFFDKFQIGYLQIQGPKVVYANHLKLPLGVKLVDPTQYIATVSKEGSIVLKFIIGKRNNSLHQNTGSESHFGNKAKDLSIVGEIGKKNIARAKKKCFYKDGSTIQSFLGLKPCKSSCMRVQDGALLALSRRQVELGFGLPHSPRGINLSQNGSKLFAEQFKNKSFDEIFLRKSWWQSRTNLLKPLQSFASDKCKAKLCKKICSAITNQRSVVQLQNSLLLEALQCVASDKCNYKSSCKVSNKCNYKTPFCRTKLLTKPCFVTLLLRFAKLTKLRTDKCKASNKTPCKSCTSANLRFASRFVSKAELCTCTANCKKICSASRASLLRSKSVRSKSVQSFAYKSTCKSKICTCTRFASRFVRDVCLARDAMLCKKFCNCTCHTQSKAKTCKTKVCVPLYPLPHFCFAHFCKAKVTQGEALHAYKAKVTQCFAKSFVRFFFCKQKKKKSDARACKMFMQLQSSTLSGALSCKEGLYDTNRQNQNFAPLRKSDVSPWSSFLWYRKYLFGRALQTKTLGSSGVVPTNRQKNGWCCKKNQGACSSFCFERGMQSFAKQENQKRKQNRKSVGCKSNFLKGLLSEQVQKERNTKRNEIGERKLKFLGSNKIFKSDICLRNVIPLDLTLTPVLKVNFVVEIDDEVLYLRQKIRERIVLEVWTNGSVHPRQAVHDSSLRLLDMFASFRSVYQVVSG